MNRNLCSHILFCAISLFAPLAASAITIPTVPVGNTGNVNDPSDGDFGTAGIQNFGAVASAYRIGTTEVTNAQYAAFLTEKAKSDPLGLYDTLMGSDARGGITQSGVSGSFTYAAKTDMGNKPVNHVGWFDSIRFANWLHNGQGTGDTETGAYTLLGGTAQPSNGLSITREPGATWFLASENEWYKAAYHQPAGQQSDTDDYWLYPTASNSVPTMATAINLAGPTRGDIGNPGTNVANFNLGADWNGQDGNVTTVGSAGLLSQSFYGTSDQGGNVWEWNEELIGPWRGIRGGSWFNVSFHLQSSSRGSYDPRFGVYDIGFRVATVPEPGTGVLAVVACGLMWVLRKWFK